MRCLFVDINICPFAIKIRAMEAVKKAPRLFSFYVLTIDQLCVHTMYVDKYVIANQGTNSKSKSKTWENSFIMCSMYNSYIEISRSFDKFLNLQSELNLTLPKLVLHSLNFLTFLKKWYTSFIVTTDIHTYAGGGLNKVLLCPIFAFCLLGTCLAIEKNF